MIITINTNSTKVHTNTHYILYDDVMLKCENYVRDNQIANHNKH